MAASTGSGKTLAFTLPVIQELINQESLGYKRQMQRPRCLILVPTRELAKQILSSVKQISHFAKMSSAAVLGGEPYGQQKTALSRNVDIVVASREFSKLLMNSRNKK
jgi:ATP-dependent RNA helicase RhlE